MRKIFFLLFTACFTFVMFGCNKSSEKGEFTLNKGKLKIAMEVGYPPFEYYDADGKTPVGFDVELGKAIAEKLGLKAVFIDTPWDGIFNGLDSGKYDLVIAAVTITDDRRAKYEFTKPYIGNSQTLIVTKQSDVLIRKLDDASGFKIGYQAKSTSDFYIEDFAKNHEGFDYYQCEYDKVLDAFDDLKCGRIDAVICDSLVASSFLSKPDSEYKQVWLGKPEEFFGICAKKGNVELISKVQGAMDEFFADGTMKDLYMDVFGFNLSDTLK